MARVPCPSIWEIFWGHPILHHACAAHHSIRAITVPPPHPSLSSGAALLLAACGRLSKTWPHCCLRLSLRHPRPGRWPHGTIKRLLRVPVMRLVTACNTFLGCWHTKPAGRSRQAFWQKSGNDRAFFLVGCVKKKAAQSAVRVLPKNCRCVHSICQRRPACPPPSWPRLHGARVPICSSQLSTCVVAGCGCQNARRPTVTLPCG